MESKEEAKKPSKPRKSKPTAVTKDNPGRIKDRPIKHLKKEHYLEIQIQFLEKENMNLELKNLNTQIDSLLKTVEILRTKMKEKKALEQSINSKHSLLIEKIKKETGIDLRGKSLDMITGEIRNSGGDVL